MLPANRAIAERIVTLVRSARAPARLAALLLAVILGAAACSSVPQPGTSASTLRSSPVAGSNTPALQASPNGASAAPSLAPTPVPATQSSPATFNVYASSMGGQLASSLASLAPRVYVPDENSGDVVVIDPATFQIIGRFKVGKSPEHVTPDWDFSHLYVNNMSSSTLTVIDPATGRPTGTISTPYPYNLYFTTDGSKAIVVDDFLSSTDLSHNGLRFYDRVTWKFLKWLEIPFAGADHLDMSADGSFLLVSCESSGEAVKVDTRTMTITGKVRVGGLPLDVRLSPDGSVFYIANQGEGGVDVVDSATLRFLGLIRTGTGAHGLGLSRDTKTLYVTNRLAGTISLIDVATRQVTATWKVGGSPDMIALSPDGSQMWVSNRYNGTIEVIDTTTGTILKVIATGANPHGLSYWPQPGRYSLGHNGNMR